MARLGAQAGRGALPGGARLLAPLLFVVATGAHAQEYCVVCSEPRAVYRCVIDGAQPQGGQPLQMLCVTAMAKAGGHGACKVTRGTVFDCDGPVKRVPWAASTAPAGAPPQRDGAAVQPEGPRPDAPPDTVVEMARRANEQTSEQMKKAGENISDGAKSVGEAVGNATKKTWDCMTSLFTRC
jgi:hypothetical protein